MILPTAFVKRFNVGDTISDATDGAKDVADTVTDTATQVATHVTDTATDIATTVTDAGKTAATAASGAVASATGIFDGIKDGASLLESLEQWKKWWDQNQHTVYVVVCIVGSILCLIVVVGMWSMCTCCYHSCCKSYKEDEKHEFKKDRVAPPQHTVCCTPVTKDDDDDHIRNEKGEKVRRKEFWERRHLRIDWTFPARNCGTRHVVHGEQWDVCGRDDNCVHDCWRGQSRCPTWCPEPCKGQRDGRYGPKKSES